MSKNHQYFMRSAIEQAVLAEEMGEVPVGAVLVQNDKIIAKAHNQPISQNDPSAHAEIQLLRQAGQKLGNYRLPNSTLYVTLEPCTMCFGAMIHARISRIIFGATDEKTGACGSCQNLATSPCFNHLIKIKGGILAAECTELLQQFFQNRRK